MSWQFFPDVECEKTVEICSVCHGTGDDLSWLDEAEPCRYCTNGADFNYVLPHEMSLANTNARDFVRYLGLPVEDGCYGSITNNMLDHWIGVLEDKLSNAHIHGLVFAKQPKWSSPNCVDLGREEDRFGRYCKEMLAGLRYAKQLGTSYIYSG